MSGWDRKYGELYKGKVTSEELWASFNYVFSDSSSKRNTYKFGLIKAILDNLFHAVPMVVHETTEYYISYEYLFGKFAENYWNLIVKYHLRQMISNSQSEYSAIEQIFMKAVEKEPELAEIEFVSIDEKTRKSLISQVTKDCKKYVIGALYQDFEGKVYSFNLSDYDGIYIGSSAYDFMVEYKTDIEKLNYYCWAGFLEKINDDNVLVRLIDKLDLATPVRKDLSVYRYVLYKEFEENNCFYCGRKLTGTPAVDHFIPWSFMKTDNLWNFVLACNTCNSKKSNRLPSEKYIHKMVKRNQILAESDNSFVREQFRTYNAIMLVRLWTYALNSGYRVMK